MGGTADSLDALAWTHFLRFPIWVLWFIAIVQQAVKYGSAQWFMGHPLIVIPGLYADAIIGHLLLRGYRPAVTVSASMNLFLLIGGAIIYPATEMINPFMDWTEILQLRFSQSAWFGLTILGLALVIQKAIRRRRAPAQTTRSPEALSESAGRSCTQSRPQLHRDPLQQQSASCSLPHLRPRRHQAHLWPACHSLGSLLSR